MNALRPAGCIHVFTFRREISKCRIKSHYYCGNSKMQFYPDQKRKGNVVIAGVKRKIKYLHLRDAKPPLLRRFFSLIFALTRKLPASDMVQILSFCIFICVFHFAHVMLFIMLGHHLKCTFIFFAKNVLHYICLLLISLICMYICIRMYVTYQNLHFCKWSSKNFWRL